ncbi:dolichyl-phosphate beta-glucosyltransferase [Cladochytrium tenue]|nr:dolichyl-phosphate beta-glucosyltransferase [Cladochytrium tenue]
MDEAVADHLAGMAATPAVESRPPTLLFLFGLPVTLLAFPVALLLIARLVVMTPSAPRKPRPSERLYTHPLTGERLPFPSLLATPQASGAAAAVAKDPAAGATEGIRKRKGGSKKASSGDDAAADDAPIDLTLVVPAFNESQRLPPMLAEALEFLEARRARDSTRTFEVIVVDDGSSDDTSAVALRCARDRASPDVRVMTLERNRGKGGAVTQGFLCARGKNILFADADGATKFSCVEDLEKKLADVATTSRGLPCGIAVGSRAHMVNSEAVVKSRFGADATHVPLPVGIPQRSFIRNFLMHGFHMYLYLLGVGWVRDTQCGFKLLSRRAATMIMPNMHVEGWIFDIELLLLARWLGAPVVEVPVSWHEVEGSKMSLGRDSIKMAIDLLTIRVNYLLDVWIVKRDE